MAPPRNRSKSANISKSALDQVGSLLQDLSAKPKQEMSIREAIDQLREPIQGAMAKGYTYEDIVQILTDSGINTTVTTVKRYISLGNPPRRKATGSKATSKRSAEEATPPKNGRRKAAKAEEPAVVATEKAEAKGGKTGRPKSTTRGRKKAV